MIISKKHYFIFLFVFLLFWFAAAKVIFSGGAGNVKNDNEVHSVHQPVHAFFQALPFSGGLVSLGHRQVNGRLAKGKFLVASRNIRDPRFKETVILLIQHDSNGTIGLIINRPTPVKLSDFIPDIKEQPGKEHVTYIGGPVGIAQILFLIQSKNTPEHSKNVPEEIQWIFDNVYVSARRTVLENLIKNPTGNTKFRIYAGYAGWSSGQLEQEVFRGDWHVAQADAAAIFDKSPEEIWQDLIRAAEIIRIEL